MSPGNIVAPLPDPSASPGQARAAVSHARKQRRRAGTTHPAFRFHSIERKKLPPCRGAMAGADRPAGAVVVVDWWCRASTRKSKPVIV